MVPDDFCDFAQDQAWKFIKNLFLNKDGLCKLHNTVEFQPFTRWWYANGLSSEGVLACSKFVSLRNNIWFCISSIQRILHFLCCSYVCILSVSKATFTFTFTFHFEVLLWRLHDNNFFIKCLFFFQNTIKTVCICSSVIPPLANFFYVPAFRFPPDAKKDLLLNFKA